MDDASQDSGSLLELVQMYSMKCNDRAFTLALVTGPAKLSEREKGKGKAKQASVPPFLQREEENLGLALGFLQQAFETLEIVDDQLHNRDRWDVIEAEKAARKALESAESKASDSEASAPYKSSESSLPTKKTTHASLAAAAAPPPPPPPPPSASSADILSDQNLIYFTSGRKHVRGDRIPQSEVDDVRRTIQRFFENEQTKRCIAQRIAGQGTSHPASDPKGEYSCGDCVNKNRHCISWEHGSKNGPRPGFIVKARDKSSPPSWKN